MHLYKFSARKLPLLYVVLIAVILLCGNTIAIDFIGFRAQYHNLHNALIIFGAIALPVLALLWNSSTFREEKSETKLLMVSVTSFAVALHFNNHFNNLFTVVYWVGLLFYLWKRRYFYRPSSLHIVIAIYVIIGAISLFWTNNLPDGLHYLKLHLVLIYIPLGFCLFKPTKQVYDTMLIAFFRWVLFFSFLSICCWILQSRAFGIPLSEAFSMTKGLFLNKYDAYNIIFAWGNYTHPTFLAVPMALGLCIGWYYLGKKQIAAVELILLIAFVLLCSIVAQSRFMIMIWVVVNIMFGVYILKNRPKLQIASIVIIALFSVSALAFYPHKIKNFFGDAVRTAHYKAAFEAIEDNGFRGTGLGGMTQYINGDNPIYLPIKDGIIYRHHSPKTEDELIRLRQTTSIDFIGLNPHNQIIGDLMQTGVPGLLSIIAIIICLIYNAIKHRNWLLGGFTTIYILLMMIEMPLMVDKGIFLFALFAFLFSAKPERE